MQPILPSQRSCARCGSTVQSARSEGLCPRCLLDSALTRGTPEEDLSCSPDENARWLTVLPEESTEEKSNRFGDYELLGVIARGGMGIVYKARQPSLNRLVALKMILAGPLASTSFVRRFQAEAKTIARLRHPNIVPVHELGEHDAQHYFAMDYIEGEDLAQRLRAGPIPIDLALDWMSQITAAIQYAHENGVLHRDLKPSNILLDAAGHIHVTDFGLAKEAAGPSDLTSPGTLLGTPCYMPPEQAAGGSNPLTPASDVYALGAILYELLTGHPPFRADTTLNTLKLVLEADPFSPRLVNPAVGRDLEVVCLKCLEKDPNQRYASARDLGDDLNRIRLGEPVLARPASLWTKGLRWAKRHPVLTSTSGTAVLFLLALTVGSVVVAWRLGAAKQETERQRRRAESQAQLAADRLADSYVANGTRLLEENDVLGALPWLTASLNLQQENADRSAIHRLRVSLVLQQCPVLQQLLVHPSYVNHAEFSPDGLHVVTACNDGNARIWEATTGQSVGQPMCHAGDVSFAIYSPDGARIATVSEDQTARFWDSRSGAPLSPSLPHSAPVNHGAFSPDGGLFATSCVDGTVQVWIVATGTRLSPALRHGESVRRAFFGPDSKSILTACMDGTARVWSVESGTELVPPLSHDESVNCAVFSPDGTAIATASADDAARVWNARSGQPLTPPLKHARAVLQIAFSPDGTRLVTACADHQARLWNARTGEALGHPMAHADIVISAVFSPDGQLVLTCSQDQTVRLWDAHSGKAASPPMKHNGWVRQAAFSPDGRRIVSVSGDHTAKIWIPFIRSPARLVLQQSGSVSRVAFNPNGESLLTTGAVPNGSGQGIFWNANTGRPCVSRLEHRDAILNTAFTPAGDHVVTCDQSGTVRVWESASGQLLWQAQERTQALQIVSFSRDGKRVMAASGPNVLPGWARVWNSTNGDPISPAFVKTNSLFSAELSRDGARLLLACGNSSSSSGPGTIEIREVTTGKTLLGPMLHQHQVLQALWSPNERQFVTVGSEQVARFWDADTGKATTNELSQAGWLIGTTFSSDGNKVATFGYDQSARIWNALTYQPITAALAHRGVVRFAQFSPDGKLLATIADDQACRLWDANTGHLVGPVIREAGSLQSLAFSPDSRKLVTAWSTGMLCLDSLTQDPRSPEELTELAEYLSGRRLDPSGGLDLLNAASLKRLSHCNE